MNKQIAVLSATRGESECIMIKLIMTLNGKTIIDTKAVKTATIDDALDIAEYAMSNGFADYARIEIDGETYVEYET